MILIALIMMLIVVIMFAIIWPTNVNVSTVYNTPESAAKCFVATLSKEK